MAIRSILMALCIAACGGGSGGGDSPRQACEDLNAAICERLYACLTADELAAAGYPASEAACVTMSESQAGCAAQTDANVCDGNEKYHADQAATCIDQISGLTCSDIRGDADLNEQAPACAKTCSV
jgi:hypothetical protein